MPDTTLDQQTESAADKPDNRFRHTIVVLSGKGGVGKSTVAVNLAGSLAARGKRVGLLDVDIHGPTVPAMLGLIGDRLEYNGKNIIPIRSGNILVMSIGFLLQHRDDAVIWRGPLKMNVIRQFLQDVDWGDIEYLIIDSPPGTGDEPLSVCQILKSIDGALVVTTPQEISAANVRKSINFCQRMKLPVLGIIENMSGFACPHCGTVTQVFNSGGGKNLAEAYSVPFLGAIPIDPAIGTACDDGTLFMQQYPDSATASAFADIVKRLSAVMESQLVKNV